MLTYYLLYLMLLYADLYILSILKYRENFLVFLRFLVIFSTLLVVKYYTLHHIVYILVQFLLILYKITKKQAHLSFNKVKKIVKYLIN